MRPIRVLVVDDTVVVRRLVSDVLDGSDDIEVAGTASNGRIAIRQIGVLQPDVVTLDVEMPIMDGLATLAEIRKHWPLLPVIMFSTLTERGASATLDALALGANDYVTKPTSARDRAAALDAVRDSLVPLVRLWGRRRALQSAMPPRPQIRPASSLSLSPSPSQAPAAVARRGPFRSPQGIVIGVSTGGPMALAQVIPALPAGLPVPVVIVQHMPPVFTKLLSQRLNTQSTVTVAEAENGMPVEPGHVYIAAGGHHLLMENRGHGLALWLGDGPMENSCRPAVDVTFRSAAKIWGASALAVILTGMGSDGLEGVRVLRSEGARVIAQDEASSVVWGMPGSVVRQGLADDVIPLDAIAPALMAAVPLASARAGRADL
jgi:two-component system chemotaxis response regulator CheB